MKYVGKTVRKLSERYKCHIYQWTRDKGRHNKLNSWIKSLANSNLKPIIELIDECDETNWKEYERGYIALLKSCGANLKNSTNGGDEPPKGCNSPEAKAKRLVTLKTSNAWKRHCEDHSVFMKNFHEENELERLFNSVIKRIYKLPIEILQKSFS